MLLEHRVAIGDADPLLIAEALGVCNVCRVRVAFLTALANSQRFTEIVLPEQRLQKLLLSM